MKRVLTNTDITMLDGELREVAEKIVGNIGRSTDTKLSVTDEEYVECVIKVSGRTKDISLTLFSLWRDWIDSYKRVAKYSFKGKVEYSEHPLILRWRKKPEITFVSCDDFEKKDTYHMYARLLITNKPEKDNYFFT